jgi:hypothetical protein
MTAAKTFRIFDSICCDAPVQVPVPSSHPA